MTVVYRRRVQGKLDDILNASFSLCNRSQASFLLFLEPKEERKFSQRNMYCLLEIHV